MTFFTPSKGMKERQPGSLSSSEALHSSFLHYLLQSVQLHSSVLITLIK